jgi:hypothetical protein
MPHGFSKHTTQSCQTQSAFQGHDSAVNAVLRNVVVPDAYGHLLRVGIVIAVDPKQTVGDCLEFLQQVSHGLQVSKDDYWKTRIPTRRLQHVAEFTMWITTEKDPWRVHQTYLSLGQGFTHCEAHDSIQPSDAHRTRASMLPD